MISRLVLVLLHAGSQVDGPTSVAPAQDEDSGKRLIRSASKGEAEGDNKKTKGKKGKELVKKEKSVDKITKKKGKSQWRSKQGKNKKRAKVMKDVEKRQKGRSKIKQSIVFTGENCDFIDFASVRTLGAGCVDGTKMVVKNK